MNNKPSKNLIPIAIIILFLIHPVHSVFGVELLPEYKEGVPTLTDDFNGDGVQETLTLSLGDEDTSSDKGLIKYTLELKSKNQRLVAKGAISQTPPELSGVKKIVVSAKKKPFIGIAYHCGAHSGGLELYSFDGKAIKKAAEFGSDGPSIQLKDVNKDGENEIVTESRDWDTNPVGNRFLETYKYDGKKWKLISVYETRTKKYLSQKRLATYEKR